MSPLAAGPLVAQLARVSVEGALFAGGVWLLCRLAPRLPAATRSLLWWAACLKLVVGLAWVAPLPLPLLPAGMERAGFASLLGGDRPAAALEGDPSSDVAPAPVGSGEAGLEGQARRVGEAARGATARGAERAPAREARLRNAPVARQDTRVLPSSQAAEVGRALPHDAGLTAPRARWAGDGWLARAVWSVGASMEKDGRPLPLAGLLVGIWILGVLAGLAVVALQIGRARRILRGSTPVSSGPVAARFASLCWEIGVRRVPALRCSDRVATPQAIGLVRPVVLLPAADLSRLSGSELEMALCHELVHLRRGDLWLGWVPALAERLFFFHPFAALAAREYALAREAACDAEVLRLLGSAPRDYGRLLLRLGTTRRPAPAFALGAAPAASTLKRRLEMLQLFSDHPRRAWTWAAAVAVLVALPSFRLVALTRAEAPAAPAGVVAVAALPTSASPAARAAQRPAPPEPPAPPRPPQPPAPVRGGGESSSWTWNSDDGDGELESFVLRIGSSHFIHGSDREAARLKGMEGDLLWFRRHGKEYVIRDAVTLRAAKELFQPQMELGERQAELGSRQAELGGRQAQLGSQQAELGGRQAELGARQAQASAEQIRRQRNDQETGDLDVQVHELGRQQGELGRQQGELGKQQAALGAQQAELGRQQGELGQQQAKASRKAEAGLAKLVDDAVARGLAQESNR